MDRPPRKGEDPPPGFEIILAIICLVLLLLAIFR